MLAATETGELMRWFLARIREILDVNSLFPLNCVRFVYYQNVEAVLTKFVKFSGKQSMRDQ